jgi:polysaccharide deacetylase 2 family uncharacterized protein YibQ
MLRLIRFALLLTLPLCQTTQAADAHIAIIIDDLGHNLKRAEAFIALLAPITFAILPHTTHAQQIAIAAHRANKEIIIHLPMANVANTPIGPGGLTANLPRIEFLIALEAAIKSVPFAQGINNHTGSYLTQQSLQMSWLMSDMKDRDLFFIDSRTTPMSVALKVAEQHSVFASSRDVFLDNDRTHTAIDAAFQYLLKKAREDGAAIAIGHPYPETLKYLRKAVPELAAQGIKIVPASSLIALQHIQATQIQRQLVEKQAPVTVSNLETASD